jgi:leader peptidase (prepilin peptidase)/N-methyltransferase
VSSSIVFVTSLGVLAGVTPAALTSTRMRPRSPARREGKSASIVLAPWIQIALGALVGAVLAARFAHSAALPAYLVLAACAVPLTAIDLATSTIPNTLLGSAACASLFCLLLAISGGSGSASLVRGTLAALAFGAGFLVLAIIAGGGFGLGDVKLLSYLALLTGYQSWDLALRGLFVGFAFAAVAALVMRRARPSKQHPLAPWLIIGAITVLIS